MDVKELKADEIKHYLKENEWVLMVVYQDNDMLSDFSILTVKNVQYNIDKNLNCCKIHLDEYIESMKHNDFKWNQNECFPEIILVHKSNLFLRIPNFCRVSKMVDIIREKIA